jgi:hypothetical protein
MFKFSAKAETEENNIMDIDESDSESDVESDFESVAEDDPYSKKVNSFLNNKAWNKHLADGDGGSTNAILRHASALEVAKNFQLGPNAAILDIGSSNGVTLTTMIAWLCNAKNDQSVIGVGIEYKEDRYKYSMQNLLELSKNNMDVNIFFGHGNIADFGENLNGFTHIYLFDCVFDPKDIKKIGSMINNSETINQIISSKDLQTLRSHGWKIELINRIGN